YPFLTFSLNDALPIFGLHPGFAATSFGSFRLQMPRGCYRRYFSPGNFLSGETRDIEFPGGEMPFSKNELPGSVILELVDVARRRSEEHTSELQSRVDI